MDWDGDFVHDKCDNCKKIDNENQHDDDNDGVGNRCDKCDNRGKKPCNERPISPHGEVQEQEETNYDKKSMVAALMEKLLEMYNSE